jgi:hypothetical protein
VPRVRPVKLYSYVVQHDTGHAPNPYFGVCTLCRCKFRKCFGKPSNIIELAEKGDWIVGTGGANPKRSAGHGKLVYAMRVDEKLTRQKYYADHRFTRKRVGTSSYERKQGDSIQPRKNFERHEQFALISRHFYYFGANAIDIPRKFPNLEKTGPGFRCDFAPAYILRFVKWLEDRNKLGKLGEPYQRAVDRPIGSKSCKLSC